MLDTAAFIVKRGREPALQFVWRAFKVRRAARSFGDFDASDAGDLAGDQSVENETGDCLRRRVATPECGKLAQVRISQRGDHLFQNRTSMFKIDHHAEVIQRASGAMHPNHPVMPVQ